MVDRESLIVDGREFILVADPCLTFGCLFAANRNVVGCSLLCLVLALFFIIRFYRRNKTAQNYPQVQLGIPDKAALPGSEPDFKLRLKFSENGDFMTKPAHFVDLVSDVGDIDTQDQYTNGPFLKSWFDLGSIKEILEILWPDENLFFHISMEDLLSLLEKAYSQPRKGPDFSYRDGAYKSHGISIQLMKKHTRGNRLFKTPMLSRLGVGPPNIRKGDCIYFAPQDSVFLVVRPFGPENPQKSESQIHYRLIGECHMGDTSSWSKTKPRLSTLPLQILILRREKTDEWTEEGYNDNTKPRHILNQSSSIGLESNKLDIDAIEESINAKVEAYRARKVEPSGTLETGSFGTRMVEHIRARRTPQSHRLGRSWVTFGWSINSKIEDYQGTERLSTAGTGSGHYMMFWKCTCGHVGFDQYTELQPGGVYKLLEVFREHGIKAFIQARSPSQPSPTYLELVRLEIFIANLYTCLRVCISAWLRNKEWSSPVAMRHGRYPDAMNDSSSAFKTAAGPTNGASSSSQNTNAHALGVNQQAQVATGAATATSATTAQSNQPSPSPASRTRGNGVTVNIREDFILLCMKVKTFLTARHDLQVSTMTRDHQLFKAFRHEYHSKFGWAYRQFSFQTIQKISFVKFALHPRYEVDGIKPDMPPLTATHYTCDPRRPDREPALGNDFLMHRFSSPINCFQDDICLKQFPKRVGERPTPGIDPDFYTGWGMHLEQGLDLQRIFLVIFFGIASAGTFGLVWGVCKSVQDGFSIASFIVGSEAVAIAIVQILLSVGAI